MCGRFARWTSRYLFARLAGLPVNEFQIGETVPSWNIAPGQACAVVRQQLNQEPHIDQLVWGFVPHWSESKPSRRPINAKLETAAEKPYFRRCFKFRRCLVAADGWYEWTQTKTGKQPWFHHTAGGGPFFFGGLWDEWRDPAGTVIPTFAILTQPAVPSIAMIHDRMPVVVAPSAYSAWLDKEVADADAIRALCVPADEVVAYRVSRAVNRADANGPELVEPLSIS